MGFDQVLHYFSIIFNFKYIDIMRISNDKLYGLLDGMLDYSSKNFINHLIHSYYSKDMVTTVKSVDGFFKCVNNDFNDRVGLIKLLL
jgi:hypothetical protein